MLISFHRFHIVNSFLNSKYLNNSNFIILYTFDLFRRLYVENWTSKRQKIDYFDPVCERIKIGSTSFKFLFENGIWLNHARTWSLNCFSAIDILYINNRRTKRNCRTCLGIQKINSHCKTAFHIFAETLACLIGTHKLHVQHCCNLSKENLPSIPL